VTFFAGLVTSSGWIQALPCCIHIPAGLPLSELLRCIAAEVACRGRQVALDIAAGLEYLHTQLQVLHSDISCRWEGDCQKTQQRTASATSGSMHSCNHCFWFLPALH
jgi:hypothetical protein